MDHNLCISVMFLDPLFHGKGDEEPEWPPSPLRLFQALLAGARVGCRSNQWTQHQAEAFQWLAGHQPPRIMAPAARWATRCTYFVPNNDSDRKERQERLTGKVARPHWLVGGDTVHFVWPIDENSRRESQSHEEVICHEARRLLALGWGIDQVVGSGRILTEAEVAALPGYQWRAWRVRRPGLQTWRVPVKDSLEDLERVHQSFLKRIDGRRYHPPLTLSRFDTVHYLMTTVLPPRPYAAFEFPQAIAFRHESTAHVAAMLRSVSCRCAKSDTHEFPGGPDIYVAGHTGPDELTPPRFSYLPLPAIGHEHADGIIRRVLIAEPFGGDGAHAGWAQDRLRNATLGDSESNERGVLLDLWRPNSRLMVRRYVGESRTWCTVTPVVLPGFDDGKHAKAEKLFLTAVAQAAIPIETISELALRKSPFWPGSQHSRHYAVPAYISRFPRWHVWIKFKELVSGPLAIGGGRHAGLGLFAASED
jgi:CRISPR-associated protein Csb2